MRNVWTGAVADRLPRFLGRLGVTLALGGLFLWLLATRIAEVDPTAIGRAVTDLHMVQWGLALAATAISFWAVGQYDAVVHRYLETGVAPAMARRAGICAIAVSQMLGLGVITGTVLRLRMLPGQSSAMAARLTVAVALSFLAGWAVVTAAVVLAVPGAPFRALAGAAMAVVAVLVVARLVWPDRMRRWPNLFTQGRLVGLAAVDTLAAALALYFLLPPDLGLSLTVLLPAFLIAQGAGLVSGAPGGVGAFEVTLLAILPAMPADPMLAAILAWRMTYYALPAVLGGLVAVLGPQQAPAEHRHCGVPPCPARAETLIEAQGEHRRLASGHWLAGRTPHVLVGLFDPLTRPQTALTHLSQAADRTDRWPAIYKCGARMAVRARAEGWHVLAIAREAWLDPDSFDLAQPSRAGLRRKLRKAAVAGVAVSQPGVLPLAEMERIATLWAARHGGERGFSMGRYAPGYVAGQQVFLAHCAGRLVGFATFHPGQTEWALDLMRHGPDAPDGTMHALMAAAIAEAARRRVPRLSLAAVPEAAFVPARLPARFLARMLARMLDLTLVRLGCDGTGLLQFKAMFAPRWQPLYLAAPHRPALALAACEIARAIAAPPPLRQTEQDHAEYGFAQAR